MIDIAETLQQQAESLAEHHDELRALSVNVMNLVELVRVQHETLERFVEWYELLNLRNEPSFQFYDRSKKALAKYNDVMGVPNE